MGSYTSNLNQIVFCTKYRDKVLAAPHRKALIKYIWRTCENKKCRVYAINGVEDHMHLILTMPTTVCVADLVKTIKISSSLFIKQNRLFPGFVCWQGGYSHFTYANEAKRNLIRYVENQERHHASKGSRQEVIWMMRQSGIEFVEEEVE